VGRIFGTSDISFAEWCDAVHTFSFLTICDFARDHEAVVASVMENFTIIWDLNWSLLGNVSVAARFCQLVYKTWVLGAVFEFTVYDAAVVAAVPP